MSYDIYLADPATGETMPAAEPHLEIGGTYAVGGTRELWLNVTYNYSVHFTRVLGPDGIRTIYGMTGAQSIPVLLAGAEQLGSDTDPDYWQPTEGNARAALLSLLRLATQGLNGVWRGD